MCSKGGKSAGVGLGLGWISGVRLGCWVRERDACREKRDSPKVGGLTEGYRHVATSRRTDDTADRATELKN